jgi:hypothetical protein
VTAELSPTRWAIDISRILRHVFGSDRFPIDVAAVAQEITRQKFPHEPITAVVGESLQNFDGALYADPAGRKGWAIVYNRSIRSRGRINFTLAHEFGHYLLHRIAHPEGFRCGQQDFVRWDSEYGWVERQANEFAANLLMPLDDFRGIIDPRSIASLAQLSECAERYQVSQIAATLRWLGYTQRRAVLVVSRDGYILWARSSERALRTGAFFRTSGRPIAIPAASLAASAGGSSDTSAHPVLFDAGTWFSAESCTETAIVSEQYDFGLSLLQLEDYVSGSRSGDPNDERDEDLHERISRIHGLE